MSQIKVEKPTPERLAELGVENWSTWECGVETFDWQYSDDETAYVQQGRVEVTTEEGQVVARFVVCVGNLHRLNKLMRTIGSLKGVRSVERRRWLGHPGPRKQAGS